MKRYQADLNGTNGVDEPVKKQATESAVPAPPSSSVVLGFLGIGKCSSFVVRGFCGGGGEGPDLWRPACVLLSPRNSEKAKKLQEEFPDRIQICSSNEDVVKGADIIFIGLLASVAEEVLPTLPFRKGQAVVSMMATPSMADLNKWINVSGAQDESDAELQVVRTIPLPAAATRVGPILLHPPGQEVCEGVMGVIGDVIACETEEQMRPLVALTGLISPFYELQAQCKDWVVEASEGGEDAGGTGEEESKISSAAGAFIGSFFSSMAAASKQYSADSFRKLAEQAATPGGLNEQALKICRDEKEVYVGFKHALSEMFKRL